MPSFPPLNDPLPTTIWSMKDKIAVGTFVIAAVAGAIFSTMGLIQLCGGNFIGLQVLNIPVVTVMTTLSGCVFFIAGLGIFTVVRTREKIEHRSQIFEAQCQTQTAASVPSYRQQVTPQHPVPLQLEMGRRTGETQRQFRERIHWPSVEAYAQFLNVTNVSKLSEIFIPDQLAAYLGPANYFCFSMATFRREMREVYEEMDRFRQQRLEDPRFRDLPFIVVIFGLMNSLHSVQAAGLLGQEKPEWTPVVLRYRARRGINDEYAGYYQYHFYTEAEELQSLYPLYRVFRPEI